MDLREESVLMSNEHSSHNGDDQSTSQPPLPSIASRIKCKTIESMKYPGVGLLRQVVLENNNNNKNNKQHLKSVVDDFTYQEIESYPLRLYVTLTFLDRFLCWNNTAKYEGWFKKKFAVANFDETAFMNSRVFWPLCLEQELASDFHHELFDSSSNSSSSCWFPSFLKTELNLVAVPTQEILPGNNRAVLQGLTLRFADNHNNNNNNQDSFLTYREFFKLRSEKVISVLNKPDILRFDDITELHCLLNVQMILDIVKGHDIVPNDGQDFKNLQVVPRGKKGGNLFIFSEEEASYLDITDNDSSACLDFDTAFHTQSSDFLILFPSITDLCSKHYERLIFRAAKKFNLKNSNNNNNNNINNDNDDGGERSKEEEAFEYDRLVGDQALQERTPFVTFFPRFLVTMSHEVNHITQGIVNHVDTSHYKMASEHDPSVFETPLAYLVAKKYSFNNNNNQDHHHHLSFMFPTGLAELSATNAIERHHFILTKLVDSYFFPYFEEFLMSYGLLQVEPIIKKKIAIDAAEKQNNKEKAVSQDDADADAAEGEEQNKTGNDESCKNQESVWAVANYFAYCQTAHFTKDVEELRSLMRLTFGKDRWHAKLYDPENVEYTKNELNRLIFDTKQVKDPVQHFRSILQPTH